MPTPPPATVGLALAEVDTPALLIDLDAFERNLQRMADFASCRGRSLFQCAKLEAAGSLAEVHLRIQIHRGEIRLLELS